MGQFLNNHNHELIVAEPHSQYNYPPNTFFVMLKDIDLVFIDLSNNRGCPQVMVHSASSDLEDIWKEIDENYKITFDGGYQEN